MTGVSVVHRRQSLWTKGIDQVSPAVPWPQYTSTLRFVATLSRIRLFERLSRAASIDVYGLRASESGLAANPTIQT
jgi:hypothetical protein